MALQSFSSAFTGFDIVTGVATGTTTWTQNNQSSVRFILQASENGTSGWTDVGGPTSPTIGGGVAGNGNPGLDGTNVPQTFSAVNLGALGGDGDVFFRIVAEPFNGAGNPRPIVTAGAVVSGNTPVCFLAGTHIATPTGDVAVETLSTGDLVLTADGRAVPVLWLGRQTVSTYFAVIEARRPVLIRAGALGENLPRRDLRVTADHAMLIDGVLVQAGALVNGSSICRMPLADLGDRFTVFHIETADHEIVLAEGAATETFIDNVTRARFDNFAEFVALYGDETRPMAELDQPRAMSARQVPPAIRAKIAALAAGDIAIAA